MEKVIIPQWYTSPEQWEEVISKLSVYVSSDFKTNTCTVDFLPISDIREIIMPDDLNNFLIIYKVFAYWLQRAIELKPIFEQFIGRQVTERTLFESRYAILTKIKEYESDRCISVKDVLKFCIGMTPEVTIPFRLQSELLDTIERELSKYNIALHLS